MNVKMTPYLDWVEGTPIVFRHYFHHSPAGDIHFLK